MSCRREAPTRRHANPTLVGGSDEEAAGTNWCRQERLPYGGPILREYAMAIIRCDRCNRRQWKLDGWNAICRNAICRKGEIIAYLCPDCQTPDENAEAEIKGGDAGAD
jgi:hypothetical protein